MSNNRPHEAESTAEEKSGQIVEENSGETKALSEAELDQVAGGTTSNVLKTRDAVAKAAVSNMR